MALELVVKILGDASQLTSSLEGASGKVEGFGGSSLKTAALVGGVVTVAAAAAVAIAGMTQAAAEDQQEQDHLNQTIIAATGSTADYTDQLDAAIAAGQDRAFTDTDVRKGLEQLVRATGSVDTATGELATAQDIARAAGVSLEDASKAVAKAHAGQDGALRKLLPGLAKGKTATETLANAQRAAAGQADKFANSTVGQEARISDSFSELGETIGSAFLPALDAILPVLIQLIKWLGQLIAVVLPPLIRLIGAVVGVFLRFIPVLSRVVGWVQSLVQWVKNAIDWLGRIKVPEIHLPFGIGGTSATQATGVAPATFGASAQGAATGSSGGVVINISGAIDPEATARQIRRILTGHGTRVGSLVAI